MKEPADNVSVGFTGTQTTIGLDQAAGIRGVLAYMFSPGMEFHHGDCVGADRTAAEIARAIGYRIVAHPPDNPVKRAFVESDETRPEKPYLVRNHEIVDETTLLVAAPRGGEVLRSGTWATVRYARKKGRNILIVRPDGVIA